MAEESKQFIRLLLFLLQCMLGEVLVASEAVNW
jgi:hypothetical protein